MAKIGEKLAIVNINDIVFPTGNKKPEDNTVEAKIVRNEGIYRLEVQGKQYDLLSNGVLVKEGTIYNIDKEGTVVLINGSKEEKPVDKNKKAKKTRGAGCMSRMSFDNI